MKCLSLRIATLGFCASSILGCQFAARPEAGSASAPRMQVEAKEPGIMKRYNSFYISDIAAYSIEGDYLRRIDDREVQNLAEEFRSKLIRSLGSRYSPIPQKTKNTAIISVALTDVSTSYAAFQILPGAIIPNALRGGASIEAKVLDSVSNEELVTVRDSRQGERQGFLSGLGKWDGVERAFDEWAMLLSSATRK